MDEVSLSVINQQVRMLEKRTENLEGDFKDLDKRVDSHDNTLGKLDVTLSGLSSQISLMDKKIDQVIQSKKHADQENTKDWVNVTKDLIKIISIFVTAAAALIASIKFGIK